MKKLSPKSLSVCLIVKNEEKMLAECLNSIQPIADQIIVLDTGSSDGTLEIAKSYNAELYHSEWSDDFSAARNESIKYATCDWILWIDADERLTQDSIHTLQKLLKFEKSPVIYKVRIKNLKEDGVNFTLSDGHRLFTNHRRIQFSGKIHEQISPSATKVGAEERSCDVVLDHYGYSFTGKEKSKKQTRNRKILLAEVAANPRSAYAHFTLGHNYKVDNELEAAERHYRTALELKQFDPSMEASLLNTYADTLFDLGRIPEAEALIQKSLNIEKLQNAAYFLSYRVCLSKKDVAGAIRSLRIILDQFTQIQKSGSRISTDIEIDKAAIRRTLGDLYIQIESWAEAAQAYESCLKESKGSIPILRKYFNALEQLENWHTALDVLGQLIQLEGEMPIYLNAIATILIRLEEFEAAIQIFLRFNELQPGDPEVRRKIASLYTKMGQLNQAKQWM